MSFKSLKRQIKDGNFSFEELEKLENLVQKKRKNEAKGRKAKTLQNLKTSLKLPEDWFEDAKAKMGAQKVDEKTAISCIRATRDTPVLCFRHFEPEIECQEIGCSEKEYPGRYGIRSTYYHLLDERFALCENCFENIMPEEKEALLDLEAAYFAAEFMAKLEKK